MKQPIYKSLLGVHLAAALVTLWCCLLPANLQAGDVLSNEVANAIEMFKKTDSSLATFFEKAAGYAVFPSITKGAAGIGAAHGEGEVFEKGDKVGLASLTQVTIGFQLGGQVYSEIVFFENEKSLQDFKLSQMKISAQVSAVAAAEGASENARYEYGVAIFTLAKTGLMFEASVGGQKFKFIPLAEPNP